MENYNANLLQDPQFGHLWLHAYSDDVNIIRFGRGIVNLDECDDVKAKIVMATNVGISMASLDTILVKNDEGLYSLLLPFADSMGYGAIYCSVEPGFSFKEVFFFYRDHKYYAIAQKEDYSWEAYKICRADDDDIPVWACGFAVPVNLHLNKELTHNLEDTLRQIDESLSLEELLKDEGMAGYLTDQAAWRNWADELKDFGKTLSKIKEFA